MQLDILGYEPLGPVHTGERAIEVAGQLLPDLVLMDVHLGSAMDGIEAAQVIRGQFDLPTVFLSAFPGESNSVRAQLAKPAGYLSKPFEDYELRDTIEAAFDGR
jgi:CheY-like chemotaxis protein